MCARMYIHMYIYIYIYTHTTLARFALSQRRRHARRHDICTCLFSDGRGRPTRPTAAALRRLTQRSPCVRSNMHCSTTVGVAAALAATCYWPISTGTATASSLAGRARAVKEARERARHGAEPSRPIATGASRE